VLVAQVGDTDGDVRYADRHTMRTVLSKFDIIPSDADFEQFFRKHLRRADGTIEIRALMVELLGENATHNPFLPKDKEAFDAQVNLAKAISGLAGTKIRNVSGMTGPAHTRLLLDGTDGEATEEAKSLLEMATTRQTKAATVHGHFAATRVGLGTGLSPQPPAGSTSSRASSPRAAQPMQAHAHAHAHAAGPADADVNHLALHVPRAPADGARGGKPRPVSAPPLMQTAQLDVATQGHGQQGQRQARRSPRAAHVHYTPQVAVDGGRPNEEGIEDEGQVPYDACDCTIPCSTHSLSRALYFVSCGRATGWASTGWTTTGKTSWCGCSGKRTTTDARSTSRPTAQYPTTRC
jgi:hypothetical protein